MQVTLAFKDGALQVIDENLKIFGLNVSVLGRKVKGLCRVNGF
jgi:hypothetical protein